MKDQIKELREKTDVSIMSCKKALEKSGGDMDKALLILKKEGAKIAEKKSDRELKAGVVESYIHAGGKVGVLLDVRCETDFVAKNEKFREFAHDVAMHIAAMNPEDEKEVLSQDFIKRADVTIGDYVKEMVQKFGENIEIAKFVRFSI